MRIKFILIVSVLIMQPGIKIFADSRDDAIKQLDAAVMPQRKEKCEFIARVGKYSQAQIDQLKQDIEKTKSRIDNRKADMDKMGPDDSSRKALAEQEDILKKQQYELTVALDGKKYYQQYQCDIVLGKNF